MLSRLRRLVGLQFRRVINKLSHFNFQLFGYKNGYNCYTTSFFSFNGINLFGNLVSRELQRILQNFHFSISKHFDFTFHFSKKNESISFSLCACNFCQQGISQVYPGLQFFHLDHPNENFCFWAMGHFTGLRGGVKKKLFFSL